MSKHTKNIKTIAILFAISSSNVSFSMEKPSSDKPGNILERIEQYKKIENQLDAKRLEDENRLSDIKFSSHQGARSFTGYEDEVERKLKDPKTRDEQRVELSQNINTQLFPSQSLFLNAKRACITQRGLVQSRRTKRKDIFIRSYRPCNNEDLVLCIQKYDEVAIQNAAKNNYFLDV